VAAEGAEAVKQERNEKTPGALSKQVLRQNTHNTQNAQEREAQSARAHAKNKLTAEATQYV